MSTETTRVRVSNPAELTLAAAVQSGQIWQLPDGQVGRKVGAGGSVGARGQFDKRGIWTAPKTAGVVLLDGGPVFWDRSARAATFRKVNDRDCFMGLCVGGAASADTTAAIDFNELARYDVDLARDPFTTALVGTQVLGGFGMYRRGGALQFVLDATNEAQKADAISVDGFDPAANAIVEGAFRIISDGAGTAPDFSIGIASATHATDADSIAEHLFIHLDGNATDIFVQSKDGTTTVAAANSTLDYTEGVAVAQRVEFWMDMRSPGDVAVYINGVRVLTSTRFRLDNATGPLFLLAHAEKTASANTYEVVVDWLRARFSEQ